MRGKRAERDGEKGGERAGGEEEAVHASDNSGTSVAWQDKAS